MTSRSDRWRVLLVFCAIGAACAQAANPPPAATGPLPPEEPIRYRAPSFEYAQCANQCQMDRDHGLTACFVADNPNKPAYPKPADCSDSGRKQYMACLALCPADTNR